MERLGLLSFFRFLGTGLAIVENMRIAISMNDTYEYTIVLLRQHTTKYAAFLNKICAIIRPR